MNYKPLAVLLIATALTGCAAVDKLDPVTQADKSIEPMPDLEQKLANKDGRADAQPYFQVLDAIQGKCYERNRTALALMAHSMSKTDKAATGNSEPINYLDALKLLYSEASLYTDSSESKQVACIEVLTHWNQQHKEMAREEAESQEYDRVMNAGKK
jgi:hypothetical protein